LYVKDVQACLAIHLPKNIDAAYTAKLAESPSQSFITGAYNSIIGGFLVLMILLLLFTCWYHNSYKRWAARERIIFKAENPEAKITTVSQGQGVVQMMTQPI